MIDANILLIEHDAIQRNILVNLLENKVNSLSIFDNISQAVEENSELSPDIIITDFNHTHNSIKTIIQKITDRFGELPIIFTSSFDDPALFLEAIKYKIENFIIKPINADQLFETLDSVHTKIKYRQELNEQKILLDQYKHIVDVSTIISITDITGKIIYVNDKFCELTGFSREELIGKKHNIMKDNAYSKEFFQEMWQTILEKRIWQGIVKNRKKNGTVFYTDTTISPILDQDGNIKEFISLKVDITDLKVQQYHLERDVITDRLTDLPNRLSLLSTLRKLRESFQIMLIDLDKFKQTNMLFGIQFGDNVLMNFSHSLIVCSKITDLRFYRLAADEFLVLYTGKDKDALKHYYQDLTKYIEQNPFIYQEITFDIEFTSIMLTYQHGDYTMVEQLQKLMSDAKNRRVSFEIYDFLPDDTTEYKTNFEWTQKIKRALQENRMELFFQPIYDTNSQQITKYESLIRMISENGEVVSPVHFLKAAKLSKHYRELTNFVITQACNQAIESTCQFSINLSIEDLTNSETLNFLIEKIRKNNLGNKIIVEVLESEGIDNFELVSSVLYRLKEEHIEIAIDDFGSGYSNFSYLTKLPIDILKIDGSLIQNISNDNSAKVIVASIILFAKELGIRCVAEFVSNEETYKIVKEMGIDFIQGYYIAEPSQKTDLKISGI